MATKLTNKQIVDGINQAAENYFKASNVKGLSEGVRSHLTAKWAHFREMAVLLSQKNPRSLEEILFTSQGWLVDAENAGLEAVKG